jgi:protein ImuB
VLRPARPAEVRLRHGRPIRVQAGPFGGHVHACAGPWRIESGWWRETPLARDYYDVELTDGGVYRIYQERPGDAWFLDGICG